MLYTKYISNRVIRVSPRENVFLYESGAKEQELVVGEQSEF